jgi:endo-beta-N-acetylglucosaminidase D
VLVLLLVLVACRYDAVTTAGQLKWQNGLTPLNAPFFDLSGMQCMVYVLLF